MGVFKCIFILLFIMASFFNLFSFRTKQSILLEEHHSVTDFGPR